MKYLIVTFAVLLLAFFALTFGTNYFLPEYVTLFDLNFFNGYLIAGSITFVGFYYFTGVSKTAEEKAKELPWYKKRLIELNSKLATAEQTIDNLQRMNNSISLSATQAAEYVIKRYDQKTIDYIQQLKEELKNTDAEYITLKTELNEKDELINKLTSDLESKKNGLASYRRRMTLIKNLAEEIKFKSGKSVWDHIVMQLKPAETEQHTGEEKSFVPSAPTKGKRAEKYKMGLH